MPWTDIGIETERLRLRAFRDSDKPAIVELASSPDVRRYLGGPLSDEQVEAIRQATVGERWGAFCVAERPSDAAIGSVAFGHQHDELEVSFDMLPPRWGRGLAAEAVAAALSWAWGNGDDDTIIAVTQTANEPSLRMLGRLGFVADAEFEEFRAAQSQLRLVRPVLSAG